MITMSHSSVRIWSQVVRGDGCQVMPHAMKDILEHYVNHVIFMPLSMRIDSHKLGHSSVLDVNPLNNSILLC